MLPIPKVLITLALVIPWGVQAGHGMFEPKLVGSMADSSLGTAVGNTAANVSTHINRRFITTTAGVWPEATIPFCWANVESKEKLEDFVIAAMKKWHTAGLPSAFQMVPATRSQCNDASERKNVLVIRYKNELSTTWGKHEREPKPSMNLTDSVTAGVEDVVANIAHEIGHAWGLGHEQQNPYFWTDTNDFTGKGGSTFGVTANQWRCTNLADYEDARERVEAKIRQYDEQGMEGSITLAKHRELICRSREIAEKYDFSASEFLPYYYKDDFKHGTTDESKIDWDSIMIYPSQAGGRRENGARLDVLLKPDGKRIPMNLVPSARDVKGLVGLYDTFHERGKMLNEMGRATKRLVDKIRKKDKGTDNICTGTALSIAQSTQAAEPVS